jgi:DNA-binding response OmpR family regulator
VPPATPPTVLIVEDHALTRRFLADHLCADGYEPMQAATIAQARALIRDGAPALAVLDLQLPDGDGLDLISELREPGGEGESALPVIVLSGRAGELHRIRGLRRGADDYLAKPYAYAELLARIEALLRRTGPRSPTARIRVGTLELDPQGRQAWLEGREIHLSGKEFGLVGMLASEPTRTFTREELLREVWGFKAEGRTRTLDTHAYRLRHKLSTGRATFVINVWGVGYRLIDAAAGG